MQNEQSAQRVSIRPGVSVLSVLRHLNYKPWFALAEFVDNAVQSFEENKTRLRQLHGEEWKLRVTIDIDSSVPGRITIRDNACGIPKSAFPRAFRPAVIPPDRSGLSEFGMGMKSAACWFSPRWQVRTKALGETSERIVRFEIDRIVRDDIEELEVEERPAESEAHYTEIRLDELHHVPVKRSLGKIKEHLTDIYRVLMREGKLDLKLSGDSLVYEEPTILFAPFFKDPNGEKRHWKRKIDFNLGKGLSVSGFAAIRDPGNYSKSGFALFRRGRLIEGSGEEGYRPPLIFGTTGASYARLRLFGELHLEGFDVSHTKDGFRWDDNEDPFLELLKEHLDTDEFPLLRQCENYRAMASKKDRVQAATKALQRTGDALAQAVAEILPELADRTPVETETSPLEVQHLLVSRVLLFDFRGEPWRVQIELSDDDAENDWLTVSDLGSSAGSADTVQIRVSMTHPFMVAFGQTEADAIEPLLRLAAAIAIAEKLARRSGLRMAGTIRRNMNEILLEALSAP